jgi:hypothetical protein
MFEMVNFMSVFFPNKNTIVKKIIITHGLRGAIRDMWPKPAGTWVERDASGGVGGDRCV